MRIDLSYRQLTQRRVRKVMGGHSGYKITSSGRAEDGIKGFETNVEAERALQAVRRRLDGSTSAECRVNELIAQATDESNLAQMFHGTFFLVNI